MSDRNEHGPVCVFCGARGTHYCQGGYVDPQLVGSDPRQLSQPQASIAYYPGWITPTPYATAILPELLDDMLERRGWWHPAYTERFW